VDVASSLKSSNAVCWHCGGAADPHATYTLVLVASTTRAPDPLGFPVRRRWGRDEVRVSVPRCLACRARNRAAMIAAFLAAAIGAAVMPALWSHFGPRGGPPRWWSGGEDPSHVMIGVGLVLGFVVAILGIALRRRLLRLRPYKTYPPVVALRARGWNWPND
jgi:hypothetical protein